MPPRKTTAAKAPAKKTTAAKTTSRARTTRSSSTSTPRTARGECSPVHKIFTGIFALLFIASVGFNIHYFTGKSGYDYMDGKGKGSLNEIEGEKKENGLTKSVVDGKVWVQIDEPIFDAIFITDKDCKTCINITDGKENFQMTFPTANIREVSSDSDEGKAFIEKGVNILPTILLSSEFKNISRYSDLEKNGTVTPAITPTETEEGEMRGEEYLEFRTNGNKRILDEERLPPLEDKDKTVIVAYLDFLQDESLIFIQQTVPEIYRAFGENIAIDIRPSTPSAEATFYSSTVMCGADALAIAEKRQAYVEGLQEVITNVPETPEDATEEDLQAISDQVTDEILAATIESLELEGDVATCVENNDGFEAVQTFTNQAQSIGVTGTPAFFVGDRFLASGDPANFKATIQEVLSERGIEVELPEEEVTPEEGESVIDVEGTEE